MNDSFDSTDPVQPIIETAEETAERQGVYGEIKRALIARGIPAEEIAFIHDFPTPVKKAEAFASVNAGRIRVLIASTDKAGCGCNLQERLIAEHHLTIPWKPAELEQREGRILRQGNIFPEVYICNYVTEGSFNAYLWQTIESKARFISQIMAGEVTARTAEDVDQLVMTAAQIKAIASGNPQILEKVALEVELTKLERLYSAWSASRQRLRRQMETIPPALDSIAREIAGHQKAIETRDRNDHADFTIDLKKSVSSDEIVVLTDRQRAGALLRQLSFVVTRESQAFGKLSRVIGGYRGFEIVARASGRQIDSLSSLFSQTDLFLRAGEGEQAYSFNLGESDAGVIQSIDAQLRGLDGRLEKSLASQRELEHRQQQIAAELNKGWTHAAAYQEKKLRLDALNQSLTKSGGEIEPSPELSDLDDDAFRPLDSGVSVHQVLSVSEQSGERLTEEFAAADDSITLPSEAAPVRSDQLLSATAAVLSPQTDDGSDQSDSEIKAQDQTKNANSLSVGFDGSHARRGKTAKRGATSRPTLTSGQPRQMGFNWS